MEYPYRRKTDYIALCDQDDTWKPDKLKKCGSSPN